jgi:signal transduction histidine kinase
MSPATSQASAPESFVNRALRVLMLAGCAGLADWFAPLIFSGHSLVLGLVFYWIALRRLGANGAILALLTGWVVLTTKWGQPYSSTLIALEGLWVGWFWRRGRNPLLADFMFWGLFGTPVSWFLYKYVYLIPHPSFEQALVVQVVNGIIAVWIAIAVSEFIPFFGPLVGKNKHDSFRDFLLKRYLVFGTFPVLIAGLLAARQFERSAFMDARNNLTATAENLALTIGTELEIGYDAVVITAARQWSLAPMEWGHRVAADLNVAHARAPHFITMLAADTSGAIIATSMRGEAGGAQLAAGVRSIADRDYFSVPLSTGLPYFSGVFQGRGLGQDIIFATSAPVINHAGDRTGVIEGSSKASTLDPVMRVNASGDAWRVLLTDRELKVISGTDFGYTPLTPLAGTALGDLIRSPKAGKPTRYTAEIGAERFSFLSVSVAVPRAGWILTVQRRSGDILLPITKGYLALVAVALLAALVAVAFTAWSIRDFLRAWGGLLAFARDPVVNLRQLDKSRGLELPREFNELIRDLSGMAERLQSERNQRELLLAELESRVQTRTQELQVALVSTQGADRAKSAFLATVSHELRTPLTSIIAGTELLKISPTAKTEMDERTLRTLAKASQVLMSVISDVLDYSKLEAGGVTIERRSFRPALLAADVVTILDPTAKQAGLALNLETRVAPEFAWNGDAAHMRHVLVNLAGNAVKFTATGGVKITTWTTAGTAPRLYFSVQDSGAGIPADQLESIFEPFVQLANTRVLSQAGTGLGLSISRKLVHAMGGEIRVFSVFGEGSKFEFWVP